MMNPNLNRRTLLRGAALLAAGAPALVNRSWPAAQDKRAEAGAPNTPEEILKILAPCPDAERSWRVTGREVPELAPFDRLIREFMTARHITSAALAVTRSSRLVCARAYSWDRPDAPELRPASPFRIASLSKPLTSAGVAWLAAQGKLRFSDKLLDHVEMVPVAGEKADPRLKSITLLHLLRHQGGWDRDKSFDPMFRDRIIAGQQGAALPIGTPHIIKHMAGVTLDFDPGTRYAYSNFGYCLLGRVIEKVTGRPYGEFMRETIFAKLGIEGIRLGETAFEKRRPEEPYYRSKDTRLHPSVIVPDTGAPGPYGAWNLENMDAHGGWIASAVDLARFCRAFDPTGGYPLLDQDHISEIFAQPPTGPDKSGAHYGCGWNVRPAGASINTWHTGSLPGTCTIMVRRNDGLNWVLLLNQRDDPSGLDYRSMDGMLHVAAGRVKSWPDHDLFEQK